METSEVICLSDSDEATGDLHEVHSKTEDVINIESDNSSEEENTYITKRKVTRRGLKLDDDFVSSSELERELEPSNIYTSRVDTFRKQRNIIQTTIPALSSILQSDDIDSRNNDDKEENIDRPCNRFCVDESNSPLTERSPSPPPSISSIPIQSSKRRTRKADKILRNSPSPPPPMPSIPIQSSKRRTRKTDKILSEMENCKLVYDVTKTLYNYKNAQAYNFDIDVDCQRTLTVKFKWQGTILRIPMQMTQKFATILPELAEKCKADTSDIFLVLKEDSVKAEDSPSSLNLTMADIIECYIVKSTNIVNDVNKINLQIQASDTRKKLIISINKASPLSCLMEEYSKQRNISLEKLKFMFDGELLNSTETPLDLDMEDDNCIDVVVSK